MGDRDPQRGLETDFQLLFENSPVLPNKRLQVIETLCLGVGRVDCLGMEGSGEVSEVTKWTLKDWEVPFPTPSKQLQPPSMLPWLGWGRREGDTLIRGHPSCHLAMLYLGWGRGMGSAPLHQGGCQLSS